MTATKTCKVTLTNTFHNSSVNVVGELVEMGHGRGNQDYDGQPAAGMACVRLSGPQAKRAAKKLCGIAECCCGNHGPRYEYLTGDVDGPVSVIGEVAK